MLSISPVTARKSARLTATTALAIILAACGGGGGGGGLNSTPPAPPPPPPPPPPAFNFVDIFPTITTATQFSVLGLQTNTLPGSSSALVSSGFAVSYDAARDAYVIDLPSQDPGRFHSGFGDNLAWGGALISDADTFLDVRIDIAKTYWSNPVSGLQHTTFGSFDDYDGFYDYDTILPAGVFAFGTATPAAAVPTTGSAVFDAMVRGLTLDSGLSVRGTASLQFDFGAGTLAGTFNPTVWSTSANATVGLGPYNFVNTVFGVGSPTFSGQLQRSGLSGLGAFNGLFTGPAAQELMAKWTAPYLNPDTSQQSEMFGVWIGKRP